MLRERQNPSDADTVQIDITYLIYVEGRDEPINFNATFDIRKEVMKAGSELEDFMQVALNHILATIDVVAEHRLILSDRRFNKAIFLTEKIEAVSILAPDEETLMGLFEE